MILAGSGVRLSPGGLAAFARVRARLGVPVATAWTHDLIPSDDPLFCGRPGSIGDRTGNFCVQSSDCLLVLGSRLNVRQVSYNWGFFARHAFKIQVDVDPAGLDKPMVRPDLPIVADAAEFLTELERQMDSEDLSAEPGGLPQHANWRVWCRARRERYPVFLPEKHVSRDGAINPSDFARVLFEELADDDMLVCGDVTACVVLFQSAKLRGSQRIFSNSGSASMGWDLPAALGAAAREGGRVIRLAGDGSLQMNIQELQTLAHHGWPVKLFVLNNGGYLSIRQTQNNFSDWRSARARAAACRSRITRRS